MLECKGYIEFVKDNRLKNRAGVFYTLRVPFYEKKKWSYFTKYKICETILVLT